MTRAFLVTQPVHGATRDIERVNHALAGIDHPLLLDDLQCFRRGWIETARAEGVVEREREVHARVASAVAFDDAASGRLKEVFPGAGDQRSVPGPLLCAPHISKQCGVELGSVQVLEEKRAQVAIGIEREAFGAECFPRVRERFVAYIKLGSLPESAR